MSGLFRYAGFGLIIDSELELPGLPPGNGEPDIVIRLGAVARVRRKATLDEEFAFNAVGVAFRIAGGREIIVDPRLGVDPGAVRIVLLGRIMAFLMRQRGWLPLHASGVVAQGKCVLFLGPSGAGKSTTAAAFHARGHQVVTDDVGAVRVVNGRCLVQSMTSRLRLLDDSRAVLGGLNLFSEFQVDKYTYNLNDGSSSGLLPVKRVYVLEEGEPMRVEAVPPLVAATLLSRHSFVKHHKTEPEPLRIHLRDCAAVATVTPVSRLIRPRSLEILPVLVRLVEDDLKKFPATA